MNREFIEDMAGNVSCIVGPAQLPAPRVKRIVKQPYYWCGFCQTTYDIDYPQLVRGESTGRMYCPYDKKRLERQCADIEVG